MNAIAPRTESTRHEKLAVAIVWAQLLMREAQREIDGKSHTLPRATAQLRAALDLLDGYSPDSEEQMCECGHIRFDHQEPAGGPCLTHGCQCGMFTEVK